MFHSLEIAGYALDTHFVFLALGAVGASVFFLFFSGRELEARTRVLVWLVGATGFLAGAWLFAELHSQHLLRTGFGSLSSMPGMSFAALAVWFFSRLRGFEPMPALAALARAYPLFETLARIGCLGAGCCRGTDTSLPWGIGYPELLPSSNLHPLPVYLLILNLVVFSFVNLSRRRNRAQWALSRILLGLGIGRFLLEPLRAGSVWIGLVSENQLWALLLAGVGVVLAWQGRKPSPSSR